MEFSFFVVENNICVVLKCKNTFLLDLHNYNCRTYVCVFFVWICFAVGGESLRWWWEEVGIGDWKGVAYIICYITKVSNDWYCDYACGFYTLNFMRLQ